MATAHQQRIFGHARAPRTIIIAKGDEVRHFVLSSWMTAGAALLASCATAGLVVVGVLAASGPHAGTHASAPSGGSAAAYETRIASLRSEVERLTTRSFVDQEKVASKVDILLSQQTQLAERYARLKPLLDRARSSGLIDGVMPPAPKPGAEGTTLAPALSFAEAQGSRALDRFRMIDRSPGAAAPPRRTDAVSADLILAIGRSIDEAELGQIDGLNSLAARARAKSAAIGSVLRAEGISPPPATPDDRGGEGGPLEPVPQERLFDAGLDGLSEALDALQSARDASTLLPLAAPVSSSAISSGFGVRSDPFLARAAMHTGIDFVAAPGSPVRATAGGKVTFASENGSYGRMVEVDHGNGLTTRYAHMSTIAVGLGEPLKAGAIVGRVGSTGRSTGPHLHYELRRAGDAIDPARYLRAGRRISALG